MKSRERVNEIKRTKKIFLGVFLKMNKEIKSKRVRKVRTKICE